MDITGIRLQNFRSYADSGWVPIGDKGIIVGENNAGKSNFVDAMRTFLKLSPRGRLDLSDFRKQDTEQTVCIDVRFENLSEEAEEAFNGHVFGGELLVRLRSEYVEDNSRVDTHTYELKRQVVKNTRIRNIESLSAEQKLEVYYEHEPELESFKTDERWKQESGASAERVIKAYRNSDVPERVEQWERESVTGTLEEFLPKLVAFEPERELDDATNTSSKSSLLYQLLDDAYDELSDETRQKLEQQQQQFQENLNDKYLLDTVSDLEESLSEKLESQISFDGSLNIGVELPEVKELIRRQAEVWLSEEHQNTIGDLGSGSRMSFLLSCLWETTQREADQMIFVLEEPENYLHPHSQRELNTSLNDLVESGHYVYLTTHSPELVKPSEYENVLRIESEGQTSRIHTAELDALTESQQETIETIVTPAESELFFSRSLLVCEGETERSILSVLNGFLRSDDADIDRFDAKGVSIIEAGGKSKIEIYLQIADQFDIPAVALIDDDTHKDDVEEDTEQLERIRDLADETIKLERDIEFELFKSITVDDFCTTIEYLTKHNIEQFPDDREDVQKAHQNQPHKSDAEVLAQLFSKYSVSKPTFARQLLDQVDNPTVSTDVEQAIRRTLELAE